MAQSLRSIPAADRQQAILRRIHSQTKGLGYWAAIDAQKSKPKS